MGISLKQAFSFVTCDKHWVSKVLIGSLLLFFPSFVYIFPGIKRLFFNPINYYLVSLFAMVVLSTMLAVTGYFFKTVHNRVVHDNGKLPSWKYFSYYIYVGLKAYIGGFIFSIPFLLVSGLLFFFAPLSISFEIIPFILAAGVLHVIYTAFYIMLALNFVLDFRISSFLNIKKAINAIKSNILNYILLVFDCLLVALSNFIVFLILINAQILALLLPFVSFYICLVYADLFAQFAVTAGEKNYQGKGCFA